jgi:hypothetical protein
MVRRKQKQAEIDAKLKEFEAKLRAELDTAPQPVFAPPPAPYEVETLVGVNAIRREG